MAECLKLNGLLFIYLSVQNISQLECSVFRKTCRGTRAVRSCEAAHGEEFPICTELSFVHMVILHFSHSTLMGEPDWFVGMTC